MNLLAIAPNMINDRIDHNNSHRELIETLNTHPQQMVRDSVPNFARIPEEVWEAIDNGELDSNPRPGVRKDSLLDQAQPITAVDGDTEESLQYFVELAHIVRDGGVQRREDIAEEIIDEHTKVVA
jgi:chromosome partitioning protein